jgi:hypothetical protein
MQAVAISPLSFSLHVFATSLFGNERVNRRRYLASCDPKDQYAMINRNDHYSFAIRRVYLRANARSTSRWPLVAIDKLWKAPEVSKPRYRFLHGFEIFITASPGRGCERTSGAERPPER